ncbi:unnamed protein product [Ophioblennius macclurei]
MALCWLPWKRCVCLILLLLIQLGYHTAGASCRILRCNSDFVAATLDLGASSGSSGVGGGGGGGGGAAPAGGGAALSREAVNSGYCSALRSYAMCTKRMERACRGDLAYHSAVQGIEDLLIQHRCPRAGPTAQPRPLPQGTLSRDACLYERSFVGREGRAPEYRHCGVFGDPHVRTFGGDFQTCAVQGAWPLIDNEYLYVQATSAPTGRGGHATVLTKITIIFKNWRQCIEQQLYQAELDNVPAAFADGSVWSGERRGHRSLAVHSRSPGRHAEIRAAHIGALLVVRQSGASLGLSVRAPRAVVEAFGPEQDLQLCVWGCPPSQRLDTLRPPRRRPSAPAPAEADAHCGALLPSRDVYFRACVFDLMASGDLNSSAAAVGALQDARAMLGEGEVLHLLPAAATGPPRLAAALLALGVLGAFSNA